MSQALIECRRSAKLASINGRFCNESLQSLKITKSEKSSVATRLADAKRLSNSAAVPAKNSGKGLAFPGQPGPGCRYYCVLLARADPLCVGDALKNYPYRRALSELQTRKLKCGSGTRKKP